MPLNPIALDIAKKRYFKKDAEGNFIEDWEGLAHRVVDHVCVNEPDDFKQTMFDLINETVFLPNSPCLVNSGTNSRIGGLTACFISKPVEDTWEDMAATIKRFGDIARRGGGVGISLSKIRPQGDPVFGSTHAKACGPVEFMRMISEVMTGITQAGFRSMACLATLSVRHPDIRNFIVCKQRANALRSFLKEDTFNHFEVMKDRDIVELNILLDKFISNFNISVLVDDDFMERVKKDETYDLVFNNQIYDTLKAKDIFDMIVDNAWKNGDPGLLFYNAMNVSPYMYSQQEVISCNPCGEICGPANTACNLGSIDISKLYNNEQFDWNRLKIIVENAVQFLDNVIDVNLFPNTDFEQWAKDNRPVGLGIMGFADLLLKKKMAYGNKESLAFSEEIMGFIGDAAHKKSVQLGKERGAPKACQYKELEYRRNVTLLAIAPTGTISLLAGCSSSVEPIFSPSIMRYDNTGTHDMGTHPDADKSYFSCALDPAGKCKEVTKEEHVRIQAAFQKHIDSATSKTINLKSDATREDIAAAYMLAHELRCKGITVYRDGCKTTQVLNTSKRVGMNSSTASPRPKELECDIHNLVAEGIEWHIVIGKLNGVPYELFALNGKQSLPEHGLVVKKKKRHYALLSTDKKVLVENIAEEEDNIDPQVQHETRRCSLELRHGIDPKYIVEQIDKSNLVITSFAKATSRIFKKYVPDQEIVNEACPECVKAGRGYGKMVYASGCKECLVCRTSKCG